MTDRSTSRSAGTGHDPAGRGAEPTVALMLLLLIVGCLGGSNSDAQSRYTAQPTPELAWELFLELNARGVTGVDLGIYDAEAKAYLRTRPPQPKGQNHIAALYKSARPEIRTREDLAAVVFPDDPDHRLAPWFFRRTAEGWRLNGSMYPGVIGYNDKNQWRFLTRDHPYGWAFTDYAIDKNGIARRRASR